MYLGKNAQIKGKDRPSAGPLFGESLRPPYFRPPHLRLTLIFLISLDVNAALSIDNLTLGLS